MSKAPEPGIVAETWFCEHGEFWGTAAQLVLCAKCGGHDTKRADEPRHYGGIFTPHLHQLCDGCFESLPDNQLSRAGVNR